MKASSGVASVRWNRMAVSVLATVIFGTAGVGAGAGVASWAGTAAGASTTGPSAALQRPHVDTGPGGGYWMASADGGIFSYGSATFFGSMAGSPLAHPVVGLATTADGGGYWLVASDGGVFAFGDAIFYGSTGGLTLNKPIVGMAASPDGKGYWLVASDGGIFNFGDALFYGSTGGLTLNKPIVGMAASPDGKGYWLVAADGGIFNFGDAAFYGSTGGLTLNKPIVGMAASPDGKGYWLVAADGGIFNFGDAAFDGSTGGLTLNEPIVGMAASLDGGGYWLVAADGGIFNFGDAGFHGSAGSLMLSQPIVGMAVVRSHATTITNGALTDVSCPTSTFCAAVDASGNAITEVGGQWSAPVMVDSGGPGGLSSVSCPTTSYCLAVSRAQHGFSVFDGSTWSPLTQTPAPAGISSDFASVSCASLTFCAAVSASTGNVSAYFPTYPVTADRWASYGAPNGALGGANGARSISCAEGGGHDNCVVLSGSGTYQTVEDGTIGSLSFVSVDGSASVSCTSASFCMAGGASSGATFVYNGSTFTAVATSFAPNGISCAGTFCAAVDGSNLYTSSGGGTWSRGTPFDASGDAVGISCATSTFCAVVGRSGDAYLLDPSA